MTVNRERMELWAQALESDKYVQCKGNLRMEARGIESGDMATWHCAVGVGMAVAEAHGVKIERREWLNKSGIPDRVLDWYGLKGNPWLNLDDGRHSSVIGANDRLGLPFWDIAQALRATYVKDQG